MPFGARIATQIDPLEQASWFPRKSLTFDMPNPPVTSANGTTQITAGLANSQYQGLVESAFALWSAVSGVKFTNVTYQNVPSDIHVGFGDLNHFEEEYGRTSGPYAATASGGPTPDVFSGPVVSVFQVPDSTETLTRLRNYDWQYDDSSILNNMLRKTDTPHAPITLFQTIVHEVGHALGLDHNYADPYSVMDDGTHETANLSIDLNDVAAIQKIYGAPVTPPQPLTLGIVSTGISSYGNITPSSATYSTQISTNTAIRPFSGFNIRDLNGLGFAIEVTVHGGGSISDGKYGNFSNGVFVETTIDAVPYPETAPNPEDKTDTYVGHFLRDLVYTPSQFDKPESDVLTLRVIDSLGRTLTENVTVNTIKNGQPDTFEFYKNQQRTALPAANRTQSDGSFQNLLTPALPDPAMNSDDLVNPQAISDGLSTGIVTTSMKFLQSETPLVGDVQNLEAATTEQGISGALVTIARDANSLGYDLKFQEPTDPSSSTFTISDQNGQALVGVTFNGYKADSGLYDTLNFLHYPSATPVA